MAPHPETLTLAARRVDAAWSAYTEGDGVDGLFDLVAEAIGNMRRALDGTRRLHLRRSRPATHRRAAGGSWIPSCACTWEGGNWTTRRRAVADFDLHTCLECSQ